jgi:L-asparaginase II
MVNELGSVRLVKNVLDQAGINVTDLKAGADWIVQSVDKVTV